MLLKNKDMHLYSYILQIDIINTYSDTAFRCRPPIQYAATAKRNKTICTREGATSAKPKKLAKLSVLFRNTKNNR